MTNEWIPVSEMLPELGLPVYVCAVDIRTVDKRPPDKPVVAALEKIKTAKTAQGISTTYEWRHSNVCRSDLLYFEPTHWMELPELPVEVKNERS